VEAPSVLVPMDFVLMIQVLFNLLDNALKYSPSGSPIDVEARVSDGALEISVMDHGFGVPPEDLGRIFDKFYRVHATDRKRAGTGLGLAICRGFVEAMGGTIVAGNRADRAGADDKNVVHCCIHVSISATVLGGEVSTSQPDSVTATSSSMRMPMFHSASGTSSAGRM